jgi:methionine aminopeptidase
MYGLVVCNIVLQQEWDYNSIQINLKHFQKKICISINNVVAIN